MDKLINNTIIARDKQEKKIHNPTKVFKIRSKDVHYPFSLNEVKIAFNGKHIGRVLKKEKISNKQGTIYTIEFCVSLDHDKIMQTISYQGNFISNIEKKEESNANNNHLPSGKTLKEQTFSSVPENSFDNSKTLYYAITSVIYDFEANELLNVLAFVTQLKNRKNQ